MTPFTPDEIVIAIDARCDPRANILLRPPRRLFCSAAFQVGGWKLSRPCFAANRNCGRNQLDRALGRIVSSDFRTLLSEKETLATRLNQLPVAPVHQQSGRLGYQFFHSSRTNEPFTAWAEIDLGSAQPIDAVVLVPVDAAYRDFPGPGYGFPVRFRVSVRDEGDERNVADFSDRDFSNPGGLPVWLPAHKLRGRYVRITMNGPWNHGDAVHVYALGEIMVMQGARNLAAGLPSSAVSASGTFESLKVWSKANLIDGQSLLGAPVADDPSPTIGYHAAIVDSPDVQKWVQVDLGEVQPLDEVRLIGAIVPQYPGRPGFGFPVRFKVEGAVTADLTAPILLRDETAQDFPNPANNPVTIRARGTPVRYLRVTATSLWERAENFAFALAELQAYVGDKNVALHQPVTCLDQFPTTGTGWQPVNLTDGFTSEHRLTEWPEWLEGLSQRREALLRLSYVNAQIKNSEVRLIKNLGLVAGGLGICTAFATLISIRHSRQSRRMELERLRKHIASDLHDEIGSNLGTIALLSEMATRNGETCSQTDVQEIHRIAQQTAESMRDIVGLMHCPATSPAEFVQRLREISGRMLSHLEWTLVGDEFKSVPSLDVQRHLLLMVKEGLHNIQKHAAATRVKIELADARGGLRLEIWDNGVGFDPSAVSSGLGLTSLRHRAELLGGDLAIVSSSTHGTRLVFTSRPGKKLRSSTL